MAFKDDDELQVYGIRVDGMWYFPLDGEFFALAQEGWFRFQDGNYGVEEDPMYIDIYAPEITAVRYIPKPVEEALATVFPMAA